MELRQAIARRRMVRAFRPDPIDPSILDDLLDRARRAPAAGNTQAISYLVLDRVDTVGRYWDLTLPEPRRAAFRWQALLDAPVLVIVLTRPLDYVERYAEPDKARPGLGADTEHWAVPYWWVDAGAVVQNLLLLATEARLGACLFGLFDHERSVLDAFAVPADRRAVATIAIGHPEPDEPGRSASRPRPPVDRLIHRNDW